MCRWQSVGVLFLVLVGSLGIRPALGAEGELRDVAAAVAQQIAADPDVAALKGQRVFVAEFLNMNVQSPTLPPIFQEMLTTALIRTKQFDVVERAQLEKALKEMKIGTSGLIDYDSAKKLGKLVGAGYMLVGSMSEDKGAIAFDARLVAIETCEGIAAAYTGMTPQRVVEGKQPPPPPPAKPITYLRDVAGSLAKQVSTDPDAAALKGQHLFIAEFKTLNMKGDILAPIFQEILTTTFIAGKQFKVVERMQLEQALRELKISASGLVDPDEVKKLGKMFGAGYMLIGSISEDKGAVSFDARLVNIETGKSITAAFANIDMHRDPKIADAVGSFVGKAESGGVLGGANFSLAWQDKLSDKNAVSFCAGDIMGTGKPILAMVSHVIARYDRETHDAMTGRLEMVLYQREKGKYAPCSTFIVRDRNPPGAGSEPPIISPLQVRLIPAEGTAWPIFYGYTSHTRWLHSYYASCQYDKVQKTFVSFEDPKFRNEALFFKMMAEDASIIVDTIQWQPCMAVGSHIMYTSPLTCQPDEDSSEWFKSGWFWNDLGEKAWIMDIFTAADVDGDGNIEVLGEETLEYMLGIYSAVNHKRKGEIEFSQSANQNTLKRSVTVWKPSGVRWPYIVVCNNSLCMDMDMKYAGRPDGGSVSLFQFNGKEYTEVWKSCRLGDEVLDVQVCDPHGDGTLGLVVLSRDVTENFVVELGNGGIMLRCAPKRTYLTRFNAN